MSKITMKGWSSLFECDAFGDEVEIELAVYFRAEKGYDMEPYGSTYARRDWLEIEEVEDLELDGQPVTLQYLHDRFNEAMVTAAIADAEENAEEDY